MKTLQLFILILSLTFIGCSHSQKLELKVLYVGNNPERPMPEFKSNEYTRDWEEAYYKEEYHTRMPAFDSLLTAHFTSVTCMDAHDYKVSDSKNYDVTIFDKAPKPIKAEVREYNDNKQIIKYEAAHYLTKDFDCAAICIADVMPRLGEPIGVKLDWQCKCLGADAFNLNLEHTIFNKPFKVNPTFKTKDTPKDVFAYPSGMNVSKQLPMWRVQKYGFEKAESGLVSHCTGFLDSPDAEIISGGASLKDIGAIAIGRHANFFLWGFSASPKDMTEEARLAFVNAVYYMKDFNGIKPLTRKFGRVVTTRDMILDYKMYSVSKEKFEKKKKNYLKKNKEKIQKVETLQQKQKNGESLTAKEKFYLKRNKIEIPTLETYLESKMGKNYAQFGNDIEAYHDFLEKDREFYYAKKGEGYGIDEDVKSLGISNRKIEILDKCVEMLKQKNDSEKAMRILNRYTDEAFKASKDWEEWLHKNHDRLFFAETSGCKWMIDTYKKPRS